LRATPVKKKQKVTHELLSLWADKEKEWLTYKQIVTELKQRGVSERTTVRYLKRLVREGKLVREERGYKKTFYKPDEDFLEMLYPSLDWIRIHEEFLVQRIKEIAAAKFEAAITDSRETDERINKLISEEIDKISKETPSDEEVNEAICSVLSRERLTESDFKILTSLVNRLLLKAIYRPFSHPFGHAGTTEPYIAISNLESSISLLLSTYMDLWAFMYKHPAASFEFEKHMQKEFPSLFREKK
jgi:hypothetical protein